MDRIQSYLDDLAGRLRLAPGTTERLLEETAGHLQDAADAFQASGLSRDEAELAAVARFGTVGEIAREANGGVFAVTGRLSFAAAQLAVVGCAAVLAGTLLAELLAKVTSTAWVYGLPAHATPAASSISHWLQVQPGASNWRDAAALENSSDSLVLRGGFAVLVLVASVLFVVVTRRRVGRLEPRVVPALGLAAFGGAALVLFVGGLTGTFGQLEWGRGQLFSDAAVALLFALAFGFETLRRARSPHVSVLPISVT